MFKAVFALAKFTVEPGSAKTSGREPKTGLGRVFNYMLGCDDDVHVVFRCTPMSIVENLALVLSC
jgi:hypothetical protein